MKKHIDISEIKVPVQDQEGNTKYEPLNSGGKQSDGSMWQRPIPLIPEGHKHYMKLENPSDRVAWCDCGFGGSIYPYNARIKNGHVFNLSGKKVI